MLFRTLLLGGVGFCALGAPARAQLWNTGPWDGRDGRPSDRTTPSSRPETRAADDFVLAPGNGLSYDITALSGRMLARDYTGAFAEIYADDGGTPAGTPSATLASLNVQVLQTGVFGQYDLLNVTINTAGLALGPGRWWVSMVCDVSGAAPPNDGYGFFCTAGNSTVQGLEGYYRTGAGAWTPSITAFGYHTDFSFTIAGAQRAASSCYPNCDGSTTAPVLNILDLVCFLNRFAAGESYANCDQSTTPPVLNVLDFVCFLNRFAAGCS